MSTLNVPSKPACASVAEVRNVDAIQGFIDRIASNGTGRPAALRSSSA